ncbi:MAG: methyltransferase [Mycobacterium sp.]|nr:MAG: methyltransferase [Mycobacterium sp.]
MNSLESPQVADVLGRLFREAEVVDAAFVADLVDGANAGIDPLLAVLDAEAKDYKDLYRRAVDNYLCVSPEFGRLLYICARACNATSIVEFGTSFGVSTIHLACAVRDNGGGIIIGTELEPSKAARAQAHMTAAGLGDLVDIRAGDALDTLRVNLDRSVDLIHLDGALSLYRPILRLLEPYLQPNALVIAENSTPDYLDYVRDPGHGYVSLPISLNPLRTNEVSLFLGHSRSDPPEFGARPSKTPYRY